MTQPHTVTETRGMLTVQKFKRCKHEFTLRALYNPRGQLYGAHSPTLRPMYLAHSSFVCPRVRLFHQKLLKMHSNFKWCLMPALIGLMAIGYFYWPALKTTISIDDSDELLGFSQCDLQVVSDANKFAAVYRQCLLDRFRESDKEIWEIMPTAVSSCFNDETFWRGWGIRPIGKPGRWSSKYVSIPRSNDSLCAVVLIRQSASSFFEDDSAEKKLNERLPRCQFHLVGKNYEGTIRPAPKFYRKFISYVGLYDDYLWSVASGKKIGYFAIDPDSVKMKKFLEELVHQPRIDYLWIDEVDRLTTDERGFHFVPRQACFHEYSVFKDLTNVTVCQVTLVAHLFPDYDIQMVCRPILKDLITSVISESKFLPFRSRYSEDTLYQMYVNVGEPYCLKKFLASKLCTNDELFSGLTEL